MDDIYIRRARLIRVIDGDTYEMRIDLGYRVEGRFHIRVRGLDAPELDTPAGHEAKALAERLFAAHPDRIVVQSYKDRQSFARWVADVYVNGTSMVELMGQTMLDGKQTPRYTPRPMSRTEWECGEEDDTCRNTK